MDRYLAGLEEFQFFFLSVHQLLSPEPDSNSGEHGPTFCSAKTKKSAQFEASRAREKIQQEQRLCQTYIRQYNALVQLVRLTSHLKTNADSNTTGHFIQRNSNHRALRSRTQGRGAIRQDRDVPRRTCRDRGTHELVDQLLRYECQGTGRWCVWDIVWILGNWHSCAIGDCDICSFYRSLDDDGIRAYVKGWLRPKARV